MFSDPRAAQEVQGLLGDHRESRENYRGELFRHGRYRVAECKDGLQWLIQRRRPRFLPGGAAWDTLAYCTTRNALLRLHRHFLGLEAPELDLLPEFFPTRRDGG